MQGDITKWEGIKALWDWKLTHSKAVRILHTSFQRKQPPHMVTLAGAVHTAVFAPTGVGKGVSIVIPFLLTCPDSMVVIDFKGELAKLTSSARRALGHRIVVVDPFNVVGGVDTFNVLGGLSPDDPLTIDHCNDLANAAVVRSGHEPDPHWNDRAEAVISAMCAAAMALAQPGDRNLQAVRRALTNDAVFKALLQHCCRSDAFGGMLARAGGDLSTMADKELAGVMSTVNRHLRFLDTAAVEQSTTASSFDPAELVKGKMTIYLVLPPEHMRAQAGLLRLWIGSLLQAVVKGGLQEKKKVHFVLDEAASLGKLDVLEDAVDKYRGYGVRLLLIYQSVGQLKKCWGMEGGDQTLLSNTTQIFFGVNDLPTAEYVSNRLGDATIVVTSGGTGTNTSRQGSGEKASESRSWSTSDNWSQSARKLLQPAEVLQLDPRIAITFTPGTPPIASWLLRYYEEDFRPKRGIGPLRAFLEAACLLVSSGALAAMFTAGIVLGKLN